MIDNPSGIIDKETAGMGMKLDATVRLITPRNNLLAFASVKIEDCFVVDNIKIVAGEKGLFVDMPSALDATGKYHDIAFPVTAAFRERVNNVVLDGYSAAIEKNRDIVKAQREVTEKLPIADRLAAGKAKADAHNVARPVPDVSSRAVGTTER